MNARQRELGQPLSACLESSYVSAAMNHSYGAIDSWRTLLDAIAVGHPLCSPQEQWWSWRGHEIHLDRVQPAPSTSRRSTLVILVHGAGGHGRLLNPFASFIARAGYPSVAPDLPGYGTTRLSGRARFTDWVELVVDLAARESKAGLRVVVMGFSVGGSVALLAAHNSDRFRGVIATTLLDLSDPQFAARAGKTPWLGKLGVAVYRHAPWLLRTIPLRLRDVVPLDKMSRDPNISRLFEDDPLIGKRRADLELLMSIGEDGARLWPDRFDTCPLLLAVPDADDWTPAQWSETTLHRYVADGRVVRLGNAGHLPLEQPGVSQLESSTLEFLAHLSD